MNIKSVVATAVAALALSTAAQASQVFNQSGTNTLGNPVSFTATFTATAGNLQIVITNNQPNETAANQGINGFTFTYTNASGPFTLGTQSGQLANINGSTVQNIAGSPTWSLVQSPLGATTLTGGQPTELIFGTTGINCNASCSNFNPAIANTLTLNILGNFTTNTFINTLTVTYGTQAGEGTLTSSSGGTPGAGSAPEPSSSALALIGVALLAGTMLRRRKQGQR